MSTCRTIVPDFSWSTWWSLNRGFCWEDYHQEGMPNNFWKLSGMLTDVSIHLMKYIPGKMISDLLSLSHFMVMVPVPWRNNLWKLWVSSPYLVWILWKLPWHAVVTTRQLILGPTFQTHVPYDWIPSTTAISPIFCCLHSPAKSTRSYRAFWQQCWKLSQRTLQQCALKAFFVKAVDTSLQYLGWRGTWSIMQKPDCWHDLITMLAIRTRSKYVMSVMLVHLWFRSKTSLQGRIGNPPCTQMFHGKSHPLFTISNMKTGCQGRLPASSSVTLCTFFGLGWPGTSLGLASCCCALKATLTLTMMVVMGTQWIKGWWELGPISHFGLTLKVWLVLASDRLAVTRSTSPTQHPSHGSVVKAVIPSSCWSGLIGLQSFTYFPVLTPAFCKRFPMVASMA